MHIHILGICGTFMGSLAQLAKAAGHRVSGSDANVYPPMSTQLMDAGIDLIEGFDPAQLVSAAGKHPDMIVVGNAMSRGNPCVEYMLNKGLPYTSGPQWLGDHILRDKWVLAVAGTHGKTTTATMLAWILDYAGMAPGYLIGGVPGNFPTSARLGDTPFFVVEADEYDTAFFDKRSKFLHYHPRTLVLNNLEFDHADIFADLAAIQTQFHHLLRTVPSEGKIIHPQEDANLNAVLAKGCWSQSEALGANGWQAHLHQGDGGSFEVIFEHQPIGAVSWQLSGLHNVNNALAAIAAARHVGVRPALACEALSAFSGVKRRMELLATVDGIHIYDDFAHHPTAIATTMEGLRKKVGTDHIIAVLEPRSNTMKLGVHRDQLAGSTAAADQVFWFQPETIGWSLAEVIAASDPNATVTADFAALLEQVAAAAKAKSGANVHVVIMSNGGFMGFHRKLISRLNGSLAATSP